MKFLLSLGLFCLIIASVEGLTTTPQTWGPEENTGETDFQSITKFDTSLGTLTQVTFTFSVISATVQPSVVKNTCVGTCQATSLTGSVAVAVAFRSNAANSISGTAAISGASNSAFVATEELIVGGPVTVPFTASVEAVTFPGNSVVITATTNLDVYKDTSPLFIFARSDITTSASGSGDAEIAYSSLGTVDYSGSVVYTYSENVAGDPQFVGFQGQHFQIHGIPNECFSLITTPDMYINSRFVYISNGQCTYNDTECFSHPGTYIDQIGLTVYDKTRMSEARVKLQAGSHSEGLIATVNDVKLPVGRKLVLSTTHNDTYIHVVSNLRITISIHELFKISIVNSDFFFNIGTSMVRGDMLAFGQNKVVAHETDTVKFPLHGLLGQTWRNVEYTTGKYIQGEPADYQVNSLFSPAFLFNLYEH